MDLVGVGGYQERVCNDRGNLRRNKTEKKPCNMAIPISAQKSEWCEEDYVELFDTSTNELVSRIKEKEILGYSELVRLDISFISTEFTGYCSYCYDGIKNYDETEIDCGGPSCIECLDKFTFFNWLIWIIWMSWIFLAVLVITFFVGERKALKGISKGIKNEKVLESEIKGFVLSPFKGVGVKEKQIKRGIKKVPVKKSKIRILSEIEDKLKQNEKQGYYLNERIGDEIKQVEIGVEKKPILISGLTLEELAEKIRQRKREGYTGTRKVESRINKAIREKQQRELEIKRRNERIALAKIKIKELNDELIEKRRQGYSGTEELKREIIEVRKEIEGDAFIKPDEKSFSVFELSRELGHERNKGYSGTEKMQKEVDKIKTQLRKKPIVKRKKLRISEIEEEIRKRKSQGYYGTMGIESQIKIENDRLKELAEKIKQRKREGYAGTRKVESRINKAIREKQQRELEIKREKEKIENLKIKLEDLNGGLEEKRRQGYYGDFEIEKEISKIKKQIEENKNDL
jgi:hypothetical protein